MPTYRVNKDAAAHARKLIDAGKYDDDTEWSDAASSADDGNAEIEKRSTIFCSTWTTSAARHAHPLVTRHARWQAAPVGPGA